MVHRAPRGDRPAQGRKDGGRALNATVQARDLAAGHGDRTLFTGLDLTIAPGDVVGVVGANGAGKSTLLRLLAGLAVPGSGQVRYSPVDARVGYLPQEPVHRDAGPPADPGPGAAPAPAAAGAPATGRGSGAATGRGSGAAAGRGSGAAADGGSGGETLADFLARRTGVAAATRELDAAGQALGDGSPGAEDRYAAALESWLALGGADLDERAAAGLASAGLTLDPATSMAALSGGQAARAGLASLLLSRYDVFALDEPTNDLDLDGLAQLERFVTGLPAGVVVVSHDREFLARTVTRIVELDLAQQQVTVFDGGYTSYLAEREVARRHARERYEEYAGRRDALTERARMQRAWMDKGVRNARRKATDPDKNVRAFRRETSEKQAAKARQTQRAIERLDVVAEPRKEWQLRMEIAAAPRSGSVVATVRGAVVRRGGFALGPVDLQLDWADRVAVTGPNGAGKSTLLALLLGRLIPDEGMASLGSGVVVGEIDQARSLFGGPVPLLRSFGEQIPDLTEAEVRTLLAKYGLTAAHVLRPAAGLSPGERTRAGLALLQARGVNLLVLDEPTNHLDLPAIEQLEQALDSYPGTLLLVSHDRRLLDQVRVTRRFEVDDGRVREREL